MNLYSKTKIQLIFASIGALFFIFALIVLNQGFSLRDVISSVEKKWIIRMTTVGTIETQIQDYHTAEVLYFLSNDAVEKEQYELTLARITSDITEVKLQYEPTIATAVGRSIFQAFAKNVDNYLSVSKELISALKTNDKESARKLFIKNTNEFNILATVTHQLLDHNIDDSSSMLKDSYTIFNQAKGTIIAGLVIMWCVLIFFAVLFSKADTKNTDKVFVSSVKKKIFTTFLIIGFCFTAFCFFVYKQFDSLNNQIHGIEVDLLSKVVLLNSINTETSYYRFNEAFHVLSTEPERIKELDAKLKTILTEVNDLNKKYYALISTEYGKKVFNEFLIKFDAYKSASNQTLNLSRVNDNEKAAVQLKQSGIFFDDFSDLLVDLIRFNKSQTLEKNHVINETIELLKIFTLTGSFFILLLLGISTLLLQSWLLDAGFDKSNLKNVSVWLTIKMKLRLAFLGMFLIFILFGFLISNQLNVVNQQNTELQKTWIPCIVLVNKMNAMVNEYRIAELQLASAINETDILLWEKHLSRLADKITQARIDYEPLITLQQERNIYQAFSSKYEEYLTYSKDMINLVHKNDRVAAMKLLQSSRNHYVVLSGDLMKLVNLNTEGSTQSVQSSKRSFDYTYSLIVLVSVIVWILVTLFMVLFDKNISVALQHLTVSIIRLANGHIQNVDEDLTERNDEIGQIADAVVEITQTLSTLTNDSLMLIDSVSAGILSARADEHQHKGEFSKIIAGMNSLIELLSKPLLEVAHIMQNLALGELGNRMEGQYGGELQVLKANVNRSLDALVKLLSELNQTMQYMADADLTHLLNSNYQGDFAVLKAYTNQSIQAVSKILSDVINNTNHAAVAITQTSEASSYVAKEAALQMQSLENVSTTVEETAHSVNDIAEKIKHSSQLTSTTANLANNGLVLLAKLIDLIQHIDAEYSKIEQITSEITRIADKTHLLSLNAGLEAMRAGEHGAGFGFVAQQIGQLAEEVNLSARNIGEVIDSSGQKVRMGVHATKEIQVGMDEIALAAKNGETNVIAISAAISQQSNAIKLLTHHINEIRQSSVSTASSAEEISTTMNHLAQTIRDTAAQVKHFKLLADK